MYTQQSRTGVPELDAVLATAQMVTPDGGDTVAAQVAQAAQQKLSPPTTPPGIGALMPGVRQQAMNAAQAAQPVTQAQMQQALQQSQMAQQSQGVAGLPAQNMRTFTAAQGGVVGYNGEDSSDVELDVSSRIKKALRELYERTETGYMQRAGATPEMIARKLGKEPTVPPAPIPEGSDRRLDIPAGGIVSPGMSQAAPPRPPTPPRSPASPPAPRPPAAPAAPQGGIAQLAARPTYDTASEAAAGAPYITAGEGDVGKLRAAEGRRAEFEKTLPDLSAKGIEALRQRMADVEAAEAQRKKDLTIDQSIAWLLGGKEGVGGSALAAQRFKAAQNAAADAFSQAKLGNQQAQLLLEKAQQERQLGRFDRAIALEKEAAALMEKARDNALKAQELAQRRAGAQFQGAVQMRGQDITAQTSAEDRANALKIANIRSTAGGEKGALTPRDIARFRAQAEKDVDAQLGKDPRYVSMKVRDPAAAETYRTKIIDERLKRVLAEEGYGAAAFAPPPAAGPVYNFADIGKK